MMPAEAMPLDRINEGAFKLHDTLGSLSERNVEEYKGWAVRWTGWMQLWNQDQIVCYWAAYREGFAKTLVSPYPGKPQWRSDGDVIDFVPQPDQGLMSSFIFARTGADPFAEACDKAKAEARAALLAVLDGLDIEEA